MEKEARRGYSAGSWQQTADGGQAMSHLPSASLGHYAALSFIVRGRGQRLEVRCQKPDFSVGAAFQPRSELRNEK